jgi:hypothetical protein
MTVSQVYGRGTDGNIKEVQADASGNLKVTPGTLLAGELQQFDRLAGGPICQKVYIDADGLAVSGPCIFYGVKVLTAGTSIDVHDAATAVAGKEVIDGEATTTAGAVLTPAGVGVGVLMDTGVYVNLTGGTYHVLFAPAA